MVVDDCLLPVNLKEVIYMETIQTKHFLITLTNVVTFPTITPGPHRSYSRTKQWYKSYFDMTLSLN